MVMPLMPSPLSRQPGEVEAGSVTLWARPASVREGSGRRPRLPCIPGPWGGRTAAPVAAAEAHEACRNASALDFRLSIVARGGRRLSVVSLGLHRLADLVTQLWGVRVLADGA